MTNTPDPREKLLAATLHDDWNTGPAAAMARRAAAHARRRRAVRHGALGVTAMAVLGAATWLGQRAHPAPPPVPTPVAPRGYEIISDDEFVALLRDRPLLVLPQETGAKKFVVLDR